MKNGTLRGDSKRFFGQENEHSFRIDWNLRANENFYVLAQQNPVEYSAFNQGGTDRMNANENDLEERIFSSSEREKIA